VRRFKDNQARLQLFAVAYNLANLLRQLALPMIKIGAEVAHHARAATFHLAEEAVPRALFSAILGRIGRPRGTGPRVSDKSRSDERGVASRRAGMVCREVGRLAEGRVERGRRGGRPSIRLAGRPNRVVFL
jgi:hypothetical protein